ncbi:hypothetical protein IFR05_015841 [Cadophora sp. M221]|nr:hypothetical protein IFR05_015841 [Cadophora sp. M221]
MITAPETVPIKSMEPDRQLQVFDQTFLLHSSALKLHSTYFRKLLDSPDKPATSTGKYRYSWIREIDGNGPEWSLISDHTMQQGVERGDLSGFSCDKRASEMSFHSFLCAIYNRPYQVETRVEVGPWLAMGTTTGQCPSSPPSFSLPSEETAHSSELSLDPPAKSSSSPQRCPTSNCPASLCLDDPAILHAAEIAYNQLRAEVTKAQEELIMVANAHRVDAFPGAAWENAIGGLMFRSASKFARMDLDICGVEYGRLHLGLLLGYLG